MTPTETKRTRRGRASRRRKVGFDYPYLGTPEESLRRIARALERQASYHERIEKVMLGVIGLAVGMPGALPPRARKLALAALSLKEKKS